MDKNEIVYGIRNLNIIERLDIITDIWDEIKESRDLEIITEDERRLLLDRLTKHKANPDSATDWTELKQDIYDRYAEKS